MQRFILTGTPSAGKTTIIRALEADGYSVVEEAATDVNALLFARGVTDPGLDPGFIDAILTLQCRRREAAALRPDEVQVHDRSAICTLALCRYAGLPVPPSLQEELVRIAAQGVFERRALFVCNQGFVTRTEVRRISFEDSLRFEALHRETYLQWGYDLVEIPRGPLAERVAATRAVIGPPSSPLPVSEQPV